MTFLGHTLMKIDVPFWESWISITVTILLTSIFIYPLVYFVTWFFNIRGLK